MDSKNGFQDVTGEIEVGPKPPRVRKAPESALADRTRIAMRQTTPEIVTSKPRLLCAPLAAVAAAVLLFPAPSD
jgi:hypothetical protein